jgi:UDP-N-acetylmuramoyl-tripeptide--D-alanyl-D-alanine ligase
VIGYAQTKVIVIMKQLKRFALAYLKFFATIQLRKYAPDIVGITGSAGKTSTLNAVEAILSQKYKTKVSRKANSEWGIPMDILGINPYSHPNIFIAVGKAILLAPIKVISYWKPYEKYVVELGVDGPDEPKNMSYLLSIVRPRTAIFLNVEPMHSEPFDHLVKETDSLKRRQAIRRVIGQEKAKLVTSVPAGSGLAILNADDDEVLKYAAKIPGETMLFGQKKGLDITIGKISQSLKGTSIEFSTKNEKASLNLANMLLPDHYAYSFAASLCVGLDEGYTLAESVDLLASHFKLPPGRASLLPGIKGSLILDSSYNASARPTIDFLELLGRIKGGQAFALLGDIRELGLETAHEHQMVAASAAKVCDRIYLVGPYMKKYALPILQAKLGDKVSWHDNALKAAQALKIDLKPATIVLIKGSQNTLFLETAVEFLMRNKKSNDKLLCRRGHFWDKKRSAAGLQ